MSVILRKRYYSSNPTTQAVIWAVCGALCVRAHLFGRRFSGTATMCGAAMRHAFSACPAAAVASNSLCKSHSACFAVLFSFENCFFMRHVLHKVRSENRKTCFVSGNLYSQMPMDMLLHSSFHQWRRSSMSNFTITWMASCCQLFLPACMIAAAFSGIELSGTVSDNIFRLNNSFRRFHDGLCALKFPHFSTGIEGTCGICKKHLPPVTARSVLMSLGTIPGATTFSHLVQHAKRTHSACNNKHSDRMPAQLS